jgi:hypothetical protein
MDIRLSSLLLCLFSMVLPWTLAMEGIVEFGELRVLKPGMAMGMVKNGMAMGVMKKSPLVPKQQDKR